ncbi:prepilin-type N-terminal cleavage/methylation domain-containing protein [Alicyclobacillus hesperidum]|uniref:Prepilin-type N-terminal cleavage/methylation domain-containing protein n=1 Tax=Alicyclobacillus hesperidum TaxID=89784 RepID=A0A1H2UPW2_9BACL|nr:prepilin-type N-terminal cleavage/methylation domain-containing protein [Alicyclobacillus hesperidum]SDW58177.1 prepilin-type N-terminal cleavage/methylation domain-containing protein [Alicyclobacillus hesperidum]
MQILKDKLQNLLKKLKEQEGVTLIELLAVVVILAILAAVGVPVVMGQINKARVATDKANEQMIADALQRAEFDYQSTAGNAGALEIGSAGAVADSVPPGSKASGIATILPTNSASTSSSGSSSNVYDLLVYGLSSSVTGGTGNGTGNGTSSSSGGYLNSVPTPQSQQGAFTIVTSLSGYSGPSVQFSYPNSSGVMTTYYIVIQ